MKYINNMQIMQRSYRQGFTLAEILITLTIIGIVAALTIPTLINNVNEAGYTAGCQDAYSKISNALHEVLAQNNSSMLSFVYGNKLRNRFCNVMTCTKTYDDTSLFDNINYSDYKNSGVSTLTSLDLSTVESNAATFGLNLSTAVLNNGSYLGFFPYGDCSGMSGSYGVANSWICADILVDVNGAQGPNMAGKDLFLFHIVQDSTTGSLSIVPAGANGDNFVTVTGSNTPCGVGGDGLTCTNQRIYNSSNLP